jgi:hypothetical protein
MRLEGYRNAGDLGESRVEGVTCYKRLNTLYTSDLSKEDIAAIDAAGALGEQRITARKGLRKFGVGVLVGVVVLALCNYFGLRIDGFLFDSLCRLICAR